MPKLFVISDVHSHLFALQKALTEKGFDPNNTEHILISCGDLFDRGPDSLELLHYIMSLPNKILIRGNHDSLLETLCMRGFPYSHDKHNGTVRTVQDISGKQSPHDFQDACAITYNKLARYRELLVNYFETQNYIFVHSWIPTYVEYTGKMKPWYQEGKTHSFCEGWRYATDNEWEDALWGNPFALASQDLNKTGKTIVFGHWHCSAGHKMLGNCNDEFEYAIWEPCYFKNTIGIDRCTAHTGEVNVLVLEDDFLAK
jgi:serine/threonine protein phosphatase 1